MNGPWYFPNDPNDPKDKAASLAAFDYTWGIFADPLFGTGDWPETLKTRIDQLSKEENRSISRLSPFTDDEKKALKGSAQFIGINYYTAAIVTDIQETLKHDRWRYTQEDYDSGTTSWALDSWRQ